MGFKRLIGPFNRLLEGKVLERMECVVVDKVIERMLGRKMMSNLFDQFVDVGLFSRCVRNDGVFRLFGRYVRNDSALCLFGRCIRYDGRFSVFVWR